MMLNEDRIAVGSVGWLKTTAFDRRKPPRTLRYYLRNEQVITNTQTGNTVDIFHHCHLCAGVRKYSVTASLPAPCVWKGTPLPELPIPKLKNGSRRSDVSTKNVKSHTMIRRSNIVLREVRPVCVLRQLEYSRERDSNTIIVSTYE